MRVDYKNIKEGVIEASTGASIWSWGEKIVIQVSDVGDGSIISVESDATAQLFSWGKDSSNERDIIDQMNKALGN